MTIRGWAWGLAAVLSAATFAGETRYWELSRQSDFLEAKELRRVVVTSRGEIRVGHELQTVRPDREKTVWCGCRLADGRILVGTGSGKIYRLADRNDAALVFDTGEGLVTDLLALGKTAYASTLPAGKIFKMSEDGKWSEHAKLSSPIVWQIVAGPDGGLIAAAGKPAAVYHVKPDGTFSKIHEPGAEQALCLAPWGEGEVLVGTAQPAQLIRLKGRKGYVLYEFGDGEVKAIRPRPDGIYAAVNSKTGVLPHELLKAVDPKPAPPPPKKPEENKPGEKKDDSPEEYLLCPPVLSDPVSGTWEGTAEIPALELKEKLTVKLTHKDGKVTGTARSEGDQEDVAMEGTFDEKTRTLKLTASREGVTLTIEGRIEAEDRFEGKFIAAMGAEKLEGTISLRRTEKPAESGDPGEKPKPPAAPGKQEERPPDRPKVEGPPAPSAPPKSAVWKLAESRTEPVAEFPFYISCLGWDGQGLLAGTDSSGRVLRLSADRTYEFSLDFKEERVLGLLMDGEKLEAVFLGGPGKVGFVSPRRAENGAVVTQVFDARFLSRWGKLTVRHRGSIQVRTRSANVARSEDQFSDWSEPLTRFPADIPSPKGRYLQLRINLQGDAVVQGVSVAYKNENQRPKLQNFKVDYQPVVVPGELPPMPPPQGPSPRLGMRHSPVKRLSWQAQDPDGDVLQFRLTCRRSGSREWIALGSGLPIPLMQFMWNTEFVPDGIYEIKVVASDEKSNNEEETLREEAISEPVLIDNTKPEVRIEAAEGSRIRGEARDAAGSILQLELQVDGGEWRTIPCKDGVLDSGREEFEVDLPKGARIASVRATDQEMNVGCSTVRLDGR
jgi:hypothetical protein